MSRALSRGAAANGGPGSPRAVRAAPAFADEEDGNGATEFAPFLDAVVKVYATHSEPNWSLPWQRKRQSSSTSSGFLIAGRRVLTNAHSVAHSSQVKLKHRGSEVKYLARVLAVGSECDLALLTVDDPACASLCSRVCDFLTQSDSVTVVGYPIGGETISVTAGVVSRIEMTAYAHSSSELLGIQIDAAINSGNSGGPVFSDDGSCVGVAFQSLGKEDADGIGYIIPTPVIEHFLSDVVAHGRFTGFPILGIEYQTMESADLRKALGLASDQKGVLVRGVEPTGSSGGLLKRGDVLLEFDGQPVAVDGTVPFRVGERIGFSHLVSGKQVGERARLKIWSDRKEKVITVTLRPPNRLLPVSPQGTPSYYVFGGVVFVPLSVPYLRSEYGTHFDYDSPVRLLEKLLHGAKRTEDEEHVVVGHVLAAEVNLGYETIVNCSVLAVDGKPVTNLLSLARLIESSTGPFVRIDLDHGQLLALDTAAARAASQSILEMHSIPKRCSADIEDALGGGDAAAAAAAGRGGRKRRSEEAREEAGAASPDEAPPAEEEQKERPASRRGQGRR